jgi:hypothetical protein
MVRLSRMRWLMVVTLASCSSPRSTPTPEPTSSSASQVLGAASDAGMAAAPTDAATADAEMAAIDAGVAKASSVHIDAPAKNVRCPAPGARTPGPRGTTPLETWRSRAELPACLAALIPADVDFDREMIVAALPTTLRGIDLRTEAMAPTRDGARLVIEYRARQQCPVCTGVQRPAPPRPPAPPTLVWRIPREPDVTTFLLVRPAPRCPPCMAP